MWTGKEFRSKAKMMLKVQLRRSSGSFKMGVALLAGAYVSI